MTPIYDDGWVIAPYSGPEAAEIWIGFGYREQDIEWLPAFLDYHRGARVAKVRYTGTSRPVWVKSPDKVKQVGKIR